jgi:NADH-quinone oxidoreductase subunit M
MRAFLEAIGYAHWILPVLLVLPLLGAGLVWVSSRGTPHDDDREYDEARRPRDVTLAVLAIELVLSLGLWWAYDPAGPRWQLAVDWPWLPDWGARITLAVDGLGVVMILLTTLLVPIALVGDWTSVRTRLRTHYVLFLLTVFGLVGSFAATDLLLFYVFWEIMLVPMYFLIGLWGGEQRIYASIKFFLYTMIGSLLMLVAIIVLWRQTGSASFHLDALEAAAHAFGKPGQLWLFAAFAVCFAIKAPLFPFHTWLPDAHTQAPTGGSVLLAGILLKMGVFGMLRFAIPFFPAAVGDSRVRLAVCILAIVGIVYGALVALVQTDLKRLVAYSSVSHMGFAMLGAFALTVPAVQGSVMVTVSHGLTTGGLFLLVGMLYERGHSRALADFGGMARVIPLFAAAFVFVAMGSIGLPGTSGFVGEFLVLLGTYEVYPLLAVVAAVGVILGAVYVLWALQRILFNELTHAEMDDLADLNRRELAVIGVLAVPILWLGITPGALLRRTEPFAQALVAPYTSVPAASPTPSAAP